MGLRRYLIFFGISAFIVLCCAESKAVDYVVENDAIRRVVSVDTTVATTALTNKLTGRTYNVTSDEFKVVLDDTDFDFQGVTLTARDFALDGKVSVRDGGRKLVVPLKNKAYNLKVKVTYEANGVFYMHKWLEFGTISGSRTISVIEVERMTISGAATSRPNSQGAIPNSVGCKGNENDGPVYADNFWMGIELPRFYNDFDGDYIRLYHYPNKVATVTEIVKSHKVVLGAADDDWKGDSRLNPIKESFFKYIREWRSTPIRPYRTYNNWYVCKQDEKAVMDFIKSDIAPLYKAGLTFDSFTIDHRWENSWSPTGGWYPAESRWPAGFVKVRAALAKYGASLDLWMPIVDRAPVPIGSAAHKHMKERFIHFTREGVTGFKMDFARYTRLKCKGRKEDINEYQLEASNEGILDIVRACRKINPDVVFYLTSYVSMSPWWLGEIDYIYENTADLVEYRDVWHYTNCLKLHVPQNSWMHMGIPGPHAKDNDFDNPGNYWHSREEFLNTERFSPVDYIFRGSMFFEVYGRFTGTARKALADLANFHTNNFDILTQQPFVSGCSDMYYWAFFHEEKGGLIKFRNRSDSAKNMTIKLDEMIRITKNPGTAFELWKVDISPYGETMYKPGSFHYGDTFTVSMPATTTPLIIRLKPAKNQSNHQEKNHSLSNQNRIQPYKQNPRYWQYKGKPVLLLGGTKDDNLFQIPDLKEHLDLLASVGGNYIRNTMSSRSDKDLEVQPFKKLSNGKYDLDQWNDEYWNRFERMLKLTRDRDIIVQIEVWAFHDFNKGHWGKNPWRAVNNISYSESGTTLKDSYGNIGKVPHDFFFTVPKLNNDDLVLAYQQKFVDKILSHSLRYGHVLYCMTNEIHPQFSPEWGWYWSEYIKDKAAAADKKVETTEMYWEIDLKKAQQRASLDRPDVFSFFEASQNSAKMGQQNWDNLQFAHHYLAEEPRPINHVKIYGADTNTWKGSTDRHATECFWRNIIGGSASSRFHRPPYGLGLSSKAQAHIKSLRLLTNEIDIFTCTPHNDLLSNRKENGAYATANPGKEYAVYFPSGAEVDIDLTAAQGRLNAKWLDIAKSRWAKEETLEGGNTVALTPPGKGHWVVLIKGKMTTKSDRIRISPRNPRYFEYKQKPVFLTGARELEMLPRVGNYPYERAVDELAKAGCNHWRIEMYLSDSDQEGKRKYPIVSTYKSWWHDPATGKQEQLDAYQKNDQGKFDLNLFNEPFWNRFQDFCELCAKKEIILTVEIWSTYAIWATSPFNPKNNINYSGPLDVGKHGRDADSEFSFVRTVPALGNRPEILKFQKKFAKKVLDCTWQAGNVLYVCGNENRWPREWVEYWADYVHKYGKSKGVRLLYTNISEHVWHRASSGEVEYLFHPAMEDVLTRNRFDFADMSQLPGGKYPPSKLSKYETVVDWYKRSANTLRPITMLKNYIGSNETDVGKKRRDVLTYFMAGAAMSGFHRPWAGECPEGRWNNCAEKMRQVYLISLKAAGQVATFTSNVEFVDTTRRNDLVSQGWCLAKPPKHYIVYLKEGGESVDVKLEQGSYRWKAFNGQSWTKEEKFDWTGGRQTFKKSGNEDWGLYIVKEEPQTH